MLPLAFSHGCWSQVLYLQNLHGSILQSCLRGNLSASFQFSSTINYFSKMFQLNTHSDNILALHFQKRKVSQLHLTWLHFTISVFVLLKWSCTYKIIQHPVVLCKGYWCMCISSFYHMWIFPKHETCDYGLSESHQDLHIRTNLILKPSLLRFLIVEIPPCLLVCGTQSP